MTGLPSPSEATRRTQSFRQHGSSPLDDLIFRLRARRILGQFPRHVEGAADLGSGHDFRLLRHLYRRGRIDRGIAVDLSLDAELASGDAPLRLVEADLNKPVDVPDESVDVVMSLAVIEHLDDPDVHLREAHRILRTGGLLLLTSPSTRSAPLLEFLAFRLHVIDAAEIADHKHYFTEQELRASLAQAGFVPSSISYHRFLMGLNQLVVARRGAQVRATGDQR